jgi:hypothetical protein
LTAVAGLAAAYTLGGVACTAFSATSDADEAGAAPGDGGVRNDDGASSGDAPDPRSEAAAPGPPFCAAYMNDPSLVFCDDFELAAAASDPFGFTSSTITPQVADVSVVADGDRTGVLQVTINDATTGTHNATLMRRLGVSSGPPTLLLEYDIKIVENDVSSTTLAALHLAGTSCEASFGLGAFDGQTVGGTRNRDTALRTYVAGEWTHVATSLTGSLMSSTGFHELTTYGGLTLVDRDAHASAAVPLAPCGTSDLVIGVGECGSGPAHITVLFDNVVVRKAP